MSAEQQDCAMVRIPRPATAKAPPAERTRPRRPCVEPRTLDRAIWLHESPSERGPSRIGPSVASAP